MGTRVTVRRFALVEEAEKACGYKDKGKVQKLRSEEVPKTCNRLIPSNCVELRRIIFSILGKRQLNGRTERRDMQRTPGSHKATAQNGRRDTHCIQGVSEKKKFKKQISEIYLSRSIKSLQF